MVQGTPLNILGSLWYLFRILTFTYYDWKSRKYCGWKLILDMIIQFFSSFQPRISWRTCYNNIQKKNLIIHGIFREQQSDYQQSIISILQVRYHLCLVKQNKNIQLSIGCHFLHAFEETAFNSRTWYPSPCCFGISATRDLSAILKFGIMIKTL